MTIKLEPHPQSHILHAIADGKQIQGQNPDGDIWFDVGHPETVLRAIGTNSTHIKWRVKPSVVIINGIECPAGIDVAPPLGAKVWSANPLEEDIASQYIWCNLDITLTRYLNRGLLHLSRENALQMAKAMLAFKVAE